jgi:hypothetical protein
MQIIEKYYYYKDLARVSRFKIYPYPAESYRAPDRGPYLKGHMPVVAPRGFASPRSGETLKKCGAVVEKGGFSGFSRRILALFHQKIVLVALLPGFQQLMAGLPSKRGHVGH